MTSDAPSRATRPSHPDEPGHAAAATIPSPAFPEAADIPSEDAAENRPPNDPAASHGASDDRPAPPADDIAPEFENIPVEGQSDSDAISSGPPDRDGDIPAPDPPAPAEDAGALPHPPRPETEDEEQDGHRPPTTGLQPAVLAFAADPQTENALREGLMHYRKPSSEYGDPQVSTGGLRAAVSALAGGRCPRVVIVDIDGLSYPAGAMHELAEFCEVGTAVIAIGSDGTARSSRELLLAGVSDYLVKPVSAEAVREAAARAAPSRPAGAVVGSVVGFAGTGGSGTTTLVGTIALQAARLGRYVSVLDLNRAMAAAAVLLDVQPAAGLDQLLDEVYGASPDLQMLEGVRVQRSQRISVYAYRWSAPPPPVASMAALEWLLEELRQRSQLVLIDGLDDPGLRFAVLARTDLRVVVAEPTGRDVLRAARVLDVLGEEVPVLLVRNRTRPLDRSPETGPFRRANGDIPPDVDIPFEATLPAIADRGWPRDRLPRRLRQPLAGLTERILATALPRGG